MSSGTPKPQVDTSKPHPARVYDWLLGGKDNYPVDVAVGEQLPEVVKRSARQNREFMHRASAYLARKGVDQFLDIGTGIPTAPNLHQIVQEINPKARIVYTDNDPIVLRHAEALLYSTPEGRTDYIQADVREPKAILERAGSLLDFERPVGLSLIALMHFIPDSDGPTNPYDIVRTLLDALAPGSYLMLSHATADYHRELEAPVTNAYARGGIPLRPRTWAEVERFFGGLELVKPPGLVSVDRWWVPGGAVPPEEPGGPAAVYGGVARVLTR
ncbi:SAM-dependent methyltransferase [Streptomyces sp. IB2014 016-6]|uniref:SAM-dependent methyltransferase n=1 Tax=Streptomyces sp. IB2014 016-6 TaxID=2517818 RepID=UPI0011CCAA10|nr:SAM-dependent methyltransferase [Streptomyces sp. IB2014 016-6]TXL83962.1 SAM-dependent methyltransferase [Streptomyces sp. IB2014 016-6]